MTTALQGAQSASALARSARGASAYYQPDDFPNRPLDERNPLITDPSAPLHHSWSRLIDDLLAIRNLEDDWDGQGAEAPHPTLADGAIVLAQQLRANGKGPADRIIAGVNGTIFFEWYDSACYTEAEVTAPNEVVFRTIRRGSDLAEVFVLSGPK